ncbi:unnamed protein product, partial [Pylaiella littoralis]
QSDEFFRLPPEPGDALLSRVVCIELQHFGLGAYLLESLLGKKCVVLL